MAGRGVTLLLRFGLINPEIIQKNMKNEFDKIISRKNSGSRKWDAVDDIFGDPDILPMWIADMDFPVAKPITEAIVA